MQGSKIKPRVDLHPQIGMLGIKSLNPCPTGKFNPDPSISFKMILQQRYGQTDRQAYGQ